MSAEPPGGGPAPEDADRAAEPSWIRRLWELETGRTDDDRAPPGAGGWPEGSDAPTGSTRERTGTAEEPLAGDRSSSQLLDAICRRADLTDLRIVGTPTDHPFGRIARAQAVTDDGARPVDLRLFRRIDGRDTLASSVADQLARWGSVGDVPGVVPLVDAGEAPRAWACTPPLGPTLRTRQCSSTAGALRDARAVTRALAALHDRGVVHAGVGPDAVVYPSHPDGCDPMLDAPGLLDVYRRHADPARFLDHRYAAPEYYADDRGIVDRATDVYQLGAVLFSQFTGRPPYDGDPDEVREAVLAEDVPDPAAVEPRLPGGVADVLTTALATDKFERYDTAGAFARDVEELCDELLDG